MAPTIITPSDSAYSEMAAARARQGSPAIFAYNELYYRAVVDGDHQFPNFVLVPKEAESSSFGKPTDHRGPYSPTKVSEKYADFPPNPYRPRR